ncbi:MAG TPA: anti-sigma factor [Acidobacteriaceae bacterium]|jgi:anti-sigma factor RsiW|nr:anti-sigma factor [Acidobacteriaceae bacterium]
MMKTCLSIQAQFSSYLDGAIQGTKMQAVATHLRQCTSCTAEFNSWCSMQRLLAEVGPAKAPPEMALRLRIAISKERSGVRQRRLDHLQMQWENSIAPFLARASAGFASAVLLLGTVTLLIGTFATPEPLAANDATVDSTSSPHFLYTLADADQRIAVLSPVVVEASIDNAGRVYDYRVVSGPVSQDVRAQLNNMLLMSVFTPARFYGQPVASHAVLSFTSIAVHG